jgi:hypothetical protein
MKDGKQQSRRPILGETDGFALSPQNGAAGTASSGFRTWRVMDLRSVHPRVPKEGRTGPSKEG